MVNEEQYKVDDFSPGERIYGILNKIKTGQQMPLRIVLFTKNFGKSFSEILELVDSTIEISEIFKNDSLILRKIDTEETFKNNSTECPYCNKKFTKEEHLEYSAKSYLIEFLNSNLMVLISSFNRTDYINLIKTFNLLYPIISRILYRSNDLKQIFDSLSKKNIEIIGKDCVAKRIYGGKKTNILYQEDSIEGFFNQAKNENVWIDSVNVLMSEIGEIRISRKGHINYSKPFNFKNFFEIFLETIINKLIIERRKGLQNKARILEKPMELHTIKLNLEKNYFSDEGNIKKLINKLISNSNYEIGVVYSSTIATHLSLFDYSNGCGFDIYINSQSEINIVPQTQTTDIALDSLIIEINDLFEEIGK